MTLAPYQFIDFYGLTSGLNTVSSAVRLDTSEARDLQNIDFFPTGGISKRNGYSKLNTTPVGASACTGLYQARYSTSGGTNIEYLVSGSKVYSMPASLNGTWTDITGGLTITAGNNNIWNFDILNDVCVMGNGNTDASVQLSSTGVASALTPGPFTKFLFPLQFRGYMWYFVPTVGATVQYDRGYFSTINLPTTVGTNNYIDIAKGQGGDIRGAVEYKTFLYVFKRHGIYQINYQPTRINSAGDLFPFTETPNPVVPGVGTQSHRSIVKFTTPSTHLTPGQELVFFVDQFGIPRIFDGVTTISFSSKIGTSRDTTILSLDDMDLTRNQYCFSINYPSRNRILCFMSSAASMQDTVWVLDYSIGFAWSRYSYFLPFNVGALFEKSDGFFTPYVGDYVGTVYETDSGTSDSGQAIDAYYVTGDHYLKSPIVKDKYFFMEIKGTTGDETQDVNIDYYFDGTDTPILSDSVALDEIQTKWGAGPPAMIWGESSWGKKSLVTKTSEINNDGKTIRVKVGNSVLNETFTLEGWSLAGQSLGTSQS